jgi:hypothetical protein
VTRSVTDAEVAAQLEDELARLSVADVLLHTAGTVATLGYRALLAEERDLEQARVAIEALRALLPVVDGSLTDELRHDLRAALADLQLAYGSAVDRTFK